MKRSRLWPRGHARRDERLAVLKKAGHDALDAYRAIFGRSCWNERDRLAFGNLERILRGNVPSHREGQLTMTRNHPSRRAIMAGTTLTAAAVVSGTSICSDASTADAELLALRPVWTKGLRTYIDAIDAKAVVEKRAFARNPAYPDRHDYSAEARTRWHEVTAERKTIAEEEGMPAVNELVETASAADSAIVDRIAAMPARTMIGLRFKVDVSADWSHDHIALVQSIMDDILAMGA
ncbi:hypothetical protein [Beijerinckia sp. L45]|uniref:hypothetical protein n=1 Tax=Beijerinckia sp. L45 TaxID=1641855 RepID=UPI00131A7128|nr:hypothetical protein [Beijerinckia sp. L45]